MRAQQITELSGPASALTLGDVPEPGTSHPMTGAEGVVVDVHAAGVSFPEVLQTRGEYQIKPPLPFVPGSEVAGVVRSAPEGAGVEAGDRVAAFCMLGGFAEVAVAPEFLTFALPDELDFAQGAGLILNYHTAYFALVAARAPRRRARRCSCTAPPAASGPRRSRSPRGSAPRRSPSSPATRRSASRARRAPTRCCAPTARGRTRPRRPPAAASTSCSTRSAATASPTACARSARAGAWSWSASPAARSPRCKVNRLLLNNTEVIGAGWGAYVLAKPEVNREIGEGVLDAGRAGLRARRSSARASRSSEAAEALQLIDERGALGKVVLELA